MEFILGERRCSASFTSDKREIVLCLHRPYEIDVESMADHTGHGVTRWKVDMLCDIIRFWAMCRAVRRARVMLTLEMPWRPVDDGLCAVARHVR